MDKRKREIDEIRNRRGKRRRRKKRNAVKCVLLLMLILAAVSVGLLSGGFAARLIRPVETDIPLFLQNDARWGEVPYGNSTIAKSGCGPVCLAMAAVGITGNEIYTPDYIAQFSYDNGYYVPNVGTDWRLMSEGAEKLGLRVKELAADRSQVLSELRRGRPIICSVLPGDFTSEGHFIVLAACDEDEKIYVNDPNSEEKSSRAWEYERLISQINAMWVYY